MATLHVKAAATGGGDGSSGDPYTLVEALAAVTAASTIIVWADAIYDVAATLVVPEIDNVLVVGVNSSGVEDGTRAHLRATDAMSGRFLDASTGGEQSRNGWKVKHLRLNGKDSGGTARSNCIVDLGYPNQSGWVFVNCAIEGSSADGITNNYNGFDLLECEVSGNVGVGVYFDEYAIATVAYCSIHDNGSDGVKLNTFFPFAGRIVQLVGCAVYRNGGHGLNSVPTTKAQLLILHNTFYDNTGSGVYIAATGIAEEVDSTCPLVVNNSFSNNGAYGLYIADLTGEFVPTIDYNHYYGNTSNPAYNGAAITEGNIDVSSVGSHNQTAAPSFADTTAGSEDFTPANASPLDATGLAAAANIQTTIGAAIAADATGGGGILRRLARLIGG